MTIEEQLQAIFDFLRCLEPEARGLAGEHLPEEFRGRLRLLADGKLDEEEREILLREIAGNPEAVRLLAECLKREDEGHQKGPGKNV